MDEPILRRPDPHAIYDVCHDAGGMTAYGWEQDPKRIAFQGARYLFVAKMLEGKGRVLEVGCADGWGARIVRQHVGALVGLDIDEKSIAEAIALRSEKWHCDFLVRDFLAPDWAPYDDLPYFDAVYSLDLLEHIPQALEGRYLARLAKLADVAVIGTPSLESQVYASEISKAGHVNCKSGLELKRTLGEFWKQVFLFGMNDVVLHTGYPPMAHYLFALCVR